MIEGVIGEWVVTESDYSLLDLELKGIGIKYNFNQNRIEFEKYSDDLLKIAHLKLIKNKKTHYFQFIEKFQHLNNYSFHGIVPYKGKFYPRLPRNIINYFSLKKNSWILDPFCGSGTTNLEAQLMGLNSVGFDISYYAYVLSKIKTELIDLNLMLIDISDSYILQKYRAIKKNLIKADNNTWNLLLILCYLDVCDLKSRINKNVSLFYLFKTKIKKIVRLIKDTQDILYKNKIKPGKSLILNKSIINSENLFDKKFDAVITSPPYLYSLDYLNRNKYFNQYFNVNVNELKKLELGRCSMLKNDVEAFQFELGIVLEILDRLTKKNGKIGIVMSDSQFQGRIIKNSRFIIEEGLKLGWDILSIINNPLIGKRTKNIFHENIILFNKS